MAKTLEQKAADTILQKPDAIELSGKKFRFEHPSSAALIAASAAASKLPRVKIDGKDVVSEMLRVGKDCTPTGEVVANLLCGARGYLSKGIRHMLYERRIRRMTIHLLEDLSPAELQELASKLLLRSDVSSFFGLTAFLIEANMLKATKAETTASGQQ